jgi:hypothetical protein
MYLVEHDKRKEFHPKNANPPILEGIPLFLAADPHKRMCESVPPTPLTSPHGEGTSDKDVLGDHDKPGEEDPYVLLY